MRVLVTGDRGWREHLYMRHILDDVHRLFGIDVLIEGCATGADELAGDHPETVRGKRRIPEGWAHLRGIPGEHYPADWLHLGRAAGPLRNANMLAMSHPDMVLAFHPNLNESKGTAHMVGIARGAGIPVYVFPHHSVDVVRIEEDGEFWLDALRSGAVL